MSNRKHFCAAPWSGLSVDPDGHARVCCVSKIKVPFSDIDSCQSSPVFDQIRQNVIDDQKQSNCDECWRQERNSIDQSWISRRSTYQYADFYHDLSDARTNRLEHLDLRWSNTCNLTCVYCGPYYSSKWNDLVGAKKSLRVNAEISDIGLSQLKFLQLTGGEPFLIKENLQLLERLYRINPDVKIEVTSNLTVIKNNAIFDALQRFQNVTIVASFESTDIQFEYIRKGANWKTFADNFKICVQSFPRVQANMVFFPLSSLAITDAIHFALDQIPSTDIFIREQTGGHGFDMLGSSVLNYIKDHNRKLAEQLNQNLRDELMTILDPLQSQRTDTYLPLYDKFDKLTGSNHRSIFHKLYQ